MPALTFGLKDITGLEDVPNASYEIRRLPADAPQRDGDTLISTVPFRSTFNRVGRAMVTLPVSAVGTYYVLFVPNYVSVTFLVDADSTTIVPVSLPDPIGPTPGPEGPPGQRGDEGPAGHAGAAGRDGSQGEVGPEGSSYLYIFQASALVPNRPVGGTFNTNDGTLVAPAGWSTDPVIPPLNQDLYFSVTVVHHTHIGVIIPVWSDVGEAGAQGPPGTTGAAGPRGHVGDTGAAGPRGHMGVRGLQGPQGDPGESAVGPAPGPGGTSDYDLLTNKPIVRLVQPSADTSHVVIQDANGTLLYTLGHGHVARVVNWGRLATGATLEAHGGYPEVTYRGTINSLPPNTWVDGDAYFEREGSNWVRNSGGHGFPYQPPNWRGAWGYRRDAEAAVTGVDDIACFILDPDNDNRVYPHVVVPPYSPGENANWRTQPVGYVDPGRLLTTPSDAIDGQGPQVVGGAWKNVHALTLDDIFPHVGRIPPPSQVQPTENYLFLTEGYSEGLRQDAVMTVGFDGALAGFGAASPGPAFGSINRPSPVVRLFGIGNADNFNQETLSSYSKTWIDDVASVYIEGVAYLLGVRFREGALFSRRIQDYPEGLDSATLDINFRMLDGDFYFTNGVGDVFTRGLYELLILDGLWTYDALTSLGIIHIDGTGPPTTQPFRPGQGYVNDLGQLWIGGGTFAYHSVDPEGTDAGFVHTKYVRNPITRTEIFDTAGDGGFTHIRNGGPTGFTQWQGAGNYVENLLWREVWNYLVEHVLVGAARATAIRYRDHAFFAGSFPSLIPALRIIDIFIGGDPFEADTYFWGDSSLGGTGLQVVTALTPGTVERSDNFFWNGPFQTGRDVQDYLEGHLYGMIKDIIEPGANVTITADDSDETLSIAATAGGGGGADGVVTAGTITAGINGIALRLERSVGNDVVIPPVSLINVLNFSDLNGGISSAQIPDDTIHRAAILDDQVNEQKLSASVRAQLGGGGGGGPFTWPVPTEIDVTLSQNLGIAIGYLIDNIANDITVQARAAGGGVAYTRIPGSWLPEENAGASIGGSGLKIPISHNRRMYLARTAAGQLLAAVNNTDVGTAFNFRITEDPVAT